MAQDRSRLTVVVPTYNRPHHCAALLRFFKASNLRHAIVVADSSRPAEAELIRAACEGIADYRRFEPNFCHKLLAAVRSVDTELVLMAADDDIAFPHGIDAAADYLARNPDYVVAHGYTLRFGLQANDVDINSIYSFVPSISHDDPLQRHYDLMRRYQAFFWAVFRRDVLISALESAQRVSGELFEELIFMNTAILQGKVAMLPLVFAMRGMEESHTPATASHPFFAFLHDAQSFFSRYLAYRDILVRFIRERNLVSSSRRFPDPTTENGQSRLEQFIDIAHATWMGREVDVGMLNHAAQFLLGQPLSLIHTNPVWAGWREPEAGDVVHLGPNGGRIIWRKAVVEAGPDVEVQIGPEEMARVEKQLEAYRLD